MGRALYSGSKSYYLGNRYFEETHNYQTAFVRHLTAEPGIKGRVLDIGCRDQVPPPLVGVPELCGTLDGVDPDESVMQHPNLSQRWHGFFEKVAIPSNAYDLAYAYNVVEHIPAARPFFETLARVLKPGGVFWALTPHTGHLFPLLSRTAELAQLKGIFHRHDPGVNPYPAYYRMNSKRTILRAVQGLPFEEATFHTSPGGWSQYFPRPLRFVPKLYDWSMGFRLPSRMLILAFRLQKSQN